MIVTLIFSFDYGWIAYCEIAQLGKKKISASYRLKLINNPYKYRIYFWKKNLKNANEKGFCVANP